MAEYKTLQGILVLIDIVNFTPQAGRLGDKNTANYTRYFQEKTANVAGKYGFHTVKCLGDAILLMGNDVEGLLEMMLDLFHRDKLEDKFGFLSKFRMVAHSGFFQFQMEEGKPIDLVSAEGIKVFRLEKNAQPWELVVTTELYQGIKSLLTIKGIDAIRLKLDEPLKGFDNEEWSPPFYKLTVLQEEEKASNLLEPKMAALEKEVQYIPVFGNIYAPVPMKDNFINLCMLCDDRAALPEKLLEKLQKSAQKTPEEWEKRAARKEFPHHDLRYHWDRKVTWQESFRNIDVPTFYKHFHYGVILGLPGAGKTTILRHIAYREFIENQKRPDGQDQMVLFIHCRHTPHYDEWYQKMYSSSPPSPGRDEALEFFTWVFLFDSKEPGSMPPGREVEFREAVSRVKQAFNNGRVTLLIDALDEAGTEKNRERIKQLFIVLYKNLADNRLYLTSRPAEGIHLFEDLKREKVPEFRVLSLTQDQVRLVARHLMEEDSEIFRKFDDAIWREEMVTRMAATPITALLVTAYFQAYEKFDHRYPMYDLLVKFILIKAWDTIKTGTFPYQNLTLFFKEVKRPKFLDSQPETRILYNALAELCFDLFYDDVEGEVQRSVSADTLIQCLAGYIQQEKKYYDQKKAEEEAYQWRERFHRDHLLLQSGAERYVFVHSTVMEYMAAYYLVRESFNQEEPNNTLLKKCMARENYLDLETVPIAAGSSLINGYHFLTMLRGLVGQTSYKEDLVYLQGIKCLAEVEWLLYKTYKHVRMKRFLKPLNKLVETNRGTVRWVYEYTRDLLLEKDKKRLAELEKQFDRQMRLSQDTLFKKFLDFDAFNKGDSELVGLRKQLLNKLVQKEPMAHWVEEYEKKNLQELSKIIDLESANLLQLDTGTYHPHDKNFKYYQKLIGKELQGFYGSPHLKHSSVVTDCIFSSDGRFIVSASGDRTLKQWEVETGREIRIFKGHGNWIMGCSLSSDDSILVSASSDGTLKLWDVETGRKIRTFIGHPREVLSCSLSSDGSLLVSASGDHTLKLWDVETGDEIRTFHGHTDAVLDCSLLPDDCFLVSSSDDNTLKLWEVETGREIRTFNGHGDTVESCSLTSDSSLLVSASADKTLKLWVVETGHEIRTLHGHEDSVRDCSLSSDGSLLVSASGDHTLKLWDVATGSEINTFHGHKDLVNSCSLSPNDSLLASASNDATIKLWDVKTGREMYKFQGHEGYVMSCSLSSDGNFLVSASGDHTLMLWDAETGRKIRVFQGHKGEVRDCSLSSDGGLLVSASFDETLKLWDVATGQEIRTFQGHTERVLGCSLSPEGDFLVSTSIDLTLKLWEVKTGQEIRTFKGHKDYVYSCLLLSDRGWVVSASFDHTLKMWDVETGQEIRTLKGHESGVINCSLSSDRNWMVSTSYDHTLKLWELKTGKVIRTFSGHKGSVGSGSLSPDNRLLVSTSFDKTVKLWDVNTGKALKTVSLPWIPLKVIFHPTIPRRVFTANANGTVTVFDL